MDESFRLDFPLTFKSNVRRHHCKHRFMSETDLYSQTEFWKLILELGEKYGFDSDSDSESGAK